MSIVGSASEVAAGATQPASLTSLDSGARRSHASRSLMDRIPTVRASDLRDDLTLIRGVDAALTRRLAGLGITRFIQIAAWRTEDVRRISDALDLGRAINQQNWIEQAQLLAEGAAPPLAADGHANIAADTVLTSTGGDPDAGVLTPAAEPVLDLSMVLARQAKISEQSERAALDLQDVFRLLRTNAPGRQSAARLALAAQRSVVDRIPPALVAPGSTPVEAVVAVAAAVPEPVATPVPEFAAASVIQPVIAGIDDTVPIRVAPARAQAARVAPLPQPPGKPLADTAHAPLVAKKIVIVSAEPIAPPTAAIITAQVARPVHVVARERLDRLEAEITALAPVLALSDSPEPDPSSSGGDANIQIIATRRPSRRTATPPPLPDDGGPRLMSRRDVEDASIVIVRHDPPVRAAGPAPNLQPEPNGVLTRLLRTFARRPAADGIEGAWKA